MSAGAVDFVHFFDYLVLARGRLLEWVRGQPPAAYTQPFPFGLGSIRATLLHTAAAEWGYAQRLAGRDYTPADNPFTVEQIPGLEAFAAAWARQAPATRTALQDLGDPGRRIEYVSRITTPPARVRTTAAGIAGQLLFHEVHHRAQVMAMLRQRGVGAQDLDYSILRWERSPLA